ncbi:E3 ubiquitin-protein ligase MARCH3 [Danaus plexippus plexippus]|uniref:E3 ubiquitin-protein ligase MARCH3 n=1 Tax=Danaus plexippus plexippus TaxID=278856 RepID=A0A212FB29_DANPL|nr:E3 ubiquitin-protein ligase MARCH3 [Danaus plexippus plexippus]
MPSARRRRFSVQNEMINHDTVKLQNETQISHQDFNLDINTPQHYFGGHKTRYRNKIIPNTSKRSSCLEVLTECRSTTSTSDIQNHTLTSDKEVTASSSNINLFTIFNSPNCLAFDGSNEKRDNEKDLKKANVEHIMRRDRTPRRDKYLHRIKVRSPKRKAPVIDKNPKKRSIGINSTNFDIETQSRQSLQVEVLKEVIDVGENTEEDEKFSNHSLEDMCRICHSGEGVSGELGNLISACSCRGTIGRVHIKCLERWLTESGKTRCELCGTKYVTRRVHKFGVLKALAMWILSHNSKHMIVDFFGIMIMTPIAVVAAGLTGRTFAGLMAQDHLTPWPLASTFVLACMTLVCYYCWIVSALTRHALGWWIWYRSHYEVRLQLQENES